MGGSGAGDCPGVREIWDGEFPNHLKQKLEEISAKLATGMPNSYTGDIGSALTPGGCDDACGRKGCTSGCEIRDGEAVCVTSDTDLCSILNHCHHNGICKFAENEGEREAVSTLTIDFFLIKALKLISFYFQFCQCKKGFSGDSCELIEGITEPLEIPQNIRKSIRSLRGNKAFRDAIRRLDDKVLANKCLELFGNPTEAEPSSFGKCCKAGLSEIDEDSPARQMIVQFCNTANVLLLKNNHDQLNLAALTLDNDAIHENIDISDPAQIAEIMQTA